MELHNTDISIHELFFLTILVYNKLKEYLIVFVLRKLNKYVYQVKSTNASSSNFKDSWKRSNLTNVVNLMSIARR